jgi:hypothetical protein
MLLPRFLRVPIPSYHTLLRNGTLETLVICPFEGARIERGGKWQLAGWV